MRNCSFVGMTNEECGFFIGGGVCRYPKTKTGSCCLTDEEQGARRGELVPSMFSRKTTKEHPFEEPYWPDGEKIRAAYEKQKREEEKRKEG